MTNLFSIFDPSTLFGFQLAWLSSMSALVLLPSLFWINKSLWVKFIVTLITLVRAEFKSILGQQFTPGGELWMISYFSFIVFNNFFGLIPYIFTSSSHLVFTLSLAFPLWVGHVFFGWLFFSNFMLAHLVPLGTPPVLMPFMVLIELVSNLIRPLTLSVRLAANMVAGHLLLCLLGNNGPLASIPILPVLLIGLVSLVVLESAVAIIQAYVFSVLLTLYVSDIKPAK